MPKLLRKPNNKLKHKVKGVRRMETTINNVEVKSDWEELGEALRNFMKIRGITKKQVKDAIKKVRAMENEKNRTRY
jgi:hypothetical protein